MSTIKKLFNFKTAGTLTLLSSILVGIPLIPTKTPAQTVSICPGLYYQEPWEDILEPPSGCPPNEYVLYYEEDELVEDELVEDGVVVYDEDGVVVYDEDGVVVYDEESVYDDDIDSGAVPPTTREVPPLPEERSEIVAKIEPYEGQVEVILDNNTNSVIRYQVLGHTDQRWLEGGDQTVLRNIPVPVTITMVREDGGLVKVMPVPADEWAESNNLRVTLDEDPTFDDTKGVLRIQADGDVLLN